MRVTKVWIVRDCDYAEAELADFIHQTDMAHIPELIIGTGAFTWRAEHTAVYTSEAEAMTDAKKRFQRHHPV